VPPNKNHYHHCRHHYHRVQQQAKKHYFDELAKKGQFMAMRGNPKATWEAIRLLEKGSSAHHHPLWRGRVWKNDVLEPNISMKLQKVRPSQFNHFKVDCGVICFSQMQWKYRSLPLLPPSSSCCCPVGACARHLFEGSCHAFWKGSFAAFRVAKNLVLIRCKFTKSRKVNKCITSFSLKPH
jgi:hypothetical protein